jgi:hypothetical protein
LVSSGLSASSDAGVPPGASSRGILLGGVQVIVLWGWFVVL